MTTKYEVERIANHSQVLRVSSNEWCYLNPEILLDTNSIVLFLKCFASDLECPHRTARGHDYGIMSSLPEHSNLAPNTVSLMRSFG